MKVVKTCVICGTEFVASKMSGIYCSKKCSRVAMRKRKAEIKSKVKEHSELLQQEEADMASLEKTLLATKDLQKLFGVSSTSVYRYLQSGILKVIKMRGKVYVRKNDIDALFDNAPAYQKRRYKRKETKEYYTLREIMEKYNIGRKAVWNRCDRLGIPKIYEGRNTFFSKVAVDAKFADLLEEIDLENYYTADQIMEMYTMSKGGVLSFVKYHNIPRVNRNGKAFYSKIHIDSLKRKGDDLDPDWYTYEEIMQKYEISKDQVSYTLKQYRSIRREKRGKFTMIFRTDFDKVIQQRLANVVKIEDSDGKERVVFHPREQERECPPTPESYYSTEEVAEMFKVTIKHACVLSNANNIPKIALKGFNFYEKKAIDILFNQKNKYSEINDWITPEEMRTTYKMTPDGVRSFIHRHKIPAKVEYGVTYYSKQHIDEIKTGYFEGRERYYSVQEAMKKYNMAKDIVFYYIKQYRITKVKKGQFVFFRKEEFDRLMAKRFGKDDLITNYQG